MGGRISPYHTVHPSISAVETIAINHKPTTALHHASSFVWPIGSCYTPEFRRQTEQRRRKRLRRKDHVDGSFDIRYCMDGSVEKNVNRLRITSYNPLVTTARRTDGRCSSSIHSSTSIQTSTTVQSINTTTNTTYFPSGYTTQHIIIQSRGWSEYDEANMIVIPIHCWYIM